ncbi:alpha/beta hydrolase [Leifsonia sp. P73]|uniref:alpha/beta hydrolase n=1 Tax=Leifsonia sp. P73 TaxID=3423959 RepID=UPI003DA3F3A1
MGLIYDSRDSASMKSALSGNLATARSVLTATQSASNHLVASLGTEELSGKGYSAIEAMFSQVLIPSLVDAMGEIDTLQTELDRYTYEDSKVSQFGVLKEDELNIQLEATKNQRDATERIMAVNSAAAITLSAVPGLGDALRSLNSQLELVLTQLENDVRDLEDRLRALHGFDAATRGLFQNTLTSGFVASPGRVAPRAGWTASDLMIMLTMIGPAEFERMLAGDPDLAQRFWDNPPPPEVVAAWWKGLTPDQREKWCQAVPAIIGNLPGLDADTRIHANMIQFQRDLYDTSIHPNSPRGVLIRDILTALRVGRFSGPGLDYEKLAKQEKPPRGLLAYNPTAEPPLAAVAVGETGAEKSGKVTWTVPGMASGLGEADRLSGWTNAAVNLYNAQDDIERGVLHMVVAWIGYAPPPAFPDTSVLEGNRARAGADRLTKELDGQWAADTILGGNPRPFTAVVGYSYGTTVVTNAVSKDGALTHGVQSVVLLASAGVEEDIPTAEALRVDGGAGRVYASQSSQDQVADAGRLGSGRGDPRDESFGAKVFSSEGDAAQGLEPTDGHDSLGYGTDRGGIGPFAHATAGHGYFNGRTEAVKNAAAAASGLDGKINGGTH